MNMPEEGYDEAEQHAPISESEWNFHNVAADELIACCLWEYARESQSVGLAAQLSWCNYRRFDQKERLAKGMCNQAKEQSEAQEYIQRAKVANFDYEEFLGRFWDSDLAFVEFYFTLIQFAGERARPWLELPSEMRKKWAGQVTDTSIFQPLSVALVGEIELLWASCNSDLLKVRANPDPRFTDEEDAALHGIAHPIENTESDFGLPGRTLVAFSVDFSRFTDTEIVEQFKDWVGASRPLQWKKPRQVFPSSKRKGHKTSKYAVALDRLALMRLLHWYTPEELKIAQPAAWKRFSSKQADFRREIRAAHQFFHEQFPFLPSEESPNSYQRLAVWMRLMDIEKGA